MSFRTDQAPLLDFRGEGIAFKANASSVSRHEYNFTHEEAVDFINFFGVSIYAWDSNKGDNVNMWTEYFVPPLDSWKRYKKFAKKFNIFPNMEMKDILFPTTPKQGVKLVIEYDNKGTSPVDFYINLYNFVDQQKVDTNVAGEGEDW